MNCTCDVRAEEAKANKDKSQMPLNQGSQNHLQSINV